ncbi:phage terminase small subunit P27 family [Bradyrhizobium japonicum]|uniref:phage terminase small subunit P27 family n=2 Tax=Bradyrhizobium TaxID=374 RepID=UPI000693485B|nr:phage terminase small subunit P27 family [Bradyrhizobium japonicum]
MGRRGPKPQPAGVKDQKAPVRSRQHKTLAAAQPVAPIPGASDAPKWLKGDGLKIFQRMAPMLRGMKLLTDADVPAFARYCTHYARWLDLQKRLKKGGDIYEIETASGKVLRAHPAFTMADRLDRMMLAFEDRFGLNPAERQRIMMARANTGAHDLFGAAAPTAKESEPREGDPAADAAPPVEPSEGPIGLLN